MRIIYYFRYVPFCMLLLMQAECNAVEKGIVVVPVADLVGQPLAEMFPSHSADFAYKHLPWSCYRSQYAANARLHQLLFHEQVLIINKTKNEVCIEVPSAFYTTTQSTTPQTRYWTHAKNIIPLSALPRTDKNHLPPAISFHQPDTCMNQTIISLVEPWHSKELNITFSAGTRFTRAGQAVDKKYVAVYALNPHTHTTQIIQIPRHLVYEAHATTRQQKVDDFLRILRRWAHAQSGSIGYVFGGCSYIQTHTTHGYSLHPSRLTVQKLSHYERPNSPEVKTGFDCSNLILRAAHIVGLPYFFKNTSTLAQKLQPLQENEAIESGDLIWIPGHVIIISDAPGNRIIEAHSYDGGYGKVHEMPLNQTFKGITTYTDLHNAYKKGIPLERLDSKGAVQQSYKTFKILKLNSLWRKRTPQPRSDHQ